MGNYAHNRLLAEADAWRELRQASEAQGNVVAGGSDIFQDWLLANGEGFGERIDIGVPMGPIKQCYENSFLALLNHDVDNKEWFYTEGVVCSNDLPILIDHAWLTNRKGEVLDLTLRHERVDGKPRERVSYFGIPFKFDYAMRAALDHGYYGLFSDGVCYNRKVVGKPVGRTKRAWPKKVKADA